MIHQMIRVDTADSLNKYLASDETTLLLKESASILVQFFIAGDFSVRNVRLIDLVQQAAPNAVVVGTSTAGEIRNGQLDIHSTNISFTYFESTQVSALALESEPGLEEETGAKLKAFMDTLPQPIAALELLSITTMGLAVDKILSVMNPSCPIFGGAAADYGFQYERLFIFEGSRVIRNGVVAVFFSGDNLQVYTDYFTGWKQLGIPLRPGLISDNGLVVKTLNGRAAAYMYRKYLGTPTDKNFLKRTFAFPFMVKRGNTFIVRTPIVTDDAALSFMADIKPDDKLYLSYGNPTELIHNIGRLQQAVADFCPQAVYLFSSISRREILRENCDLETLPFQDIAPTGGFYSFSEVIGQEESQYVLNSALVAAAMREGPATPTSAEFEPSERRKRIRNSLISRFTRFIEATSDDYEEKRRELKELSMTDELTGLANRRRMEKQYVQRREQNKLSAVFLVDIDHFKQINDCFGHMEGDRILREAAGLLSQVKGLCGRWGGEEFLIFPDGNDAAAQAERLRAAFEACHFGITLPVTVSIGLSYLEPGDDLTDLCQKADEALYQAKASGRNQVCTKGTPV